MMQLKNEIYCLTIWNLKPNWKANQQNNDYAMVEIEWNAEWNVRVVQSMPNMPQKPKQ